MFLNILKKFFLSFFLYFFFTNFWVFETFTLFFKLKKFNIFLQNNIINVKAAKVPWYKENNICVDTHITTHAPKVFFFTIFF
jgi:hypothetical protein